MCAASGKYLRISIGSRRRTPSPRSSADLEWLAQQRGESSHEDRSADCTRVVVLAALAAGSALNVARGNHYILPCAPDCREADAIPDRSRHHRQLVRSPSQTGQGFSIQVLPGQPLQIDGLVVRVRARRRSILDHRLRVRSPAREPCCRATRWRAPAGDSRRHSTRPRPFRILGHADLHVQRLQSRPRDMGVDGAGLRQRKHEPRRLTLPAGLTCRGDPAGHCR